MKTNLEPIDRPLALKDEAYIRIRELILSGDLAWGERLPIDWLSSELDISRTPIREALLKLEQDHLVTTVPYKGTFVAEVSRKEVEEVYQVRESLEALATRLATPLIPDEELEEVQALFDAIADEIGNGFSDRHFESDTRLHELILSHCGNEVLQELLTGLSDRIHRVRRFSARQGSSHLEESFREHCLILDAVIHRNAPEAERLMGKHIRNAGKRIVDLVGC